MITRLGKVPYAQAWEHQEARRARVLANPQDPGEIFFVEHPPTLTLGRGEDGSSFLQARTWYAQEGIDVIQSNRGGKVTYHGPGQWVCYPVIRLSYFGWGVKRYVYILEELMIRLCAHYRVDVTRREGFPIAVLEAMRAGLPVVASDVGGIAEALSDGETGALVRPGDPEALADALAPLLRDPALRLQQGRAGRQRFLAEFAFATHLRRIWAVYAELCGLMSPSTEP